MLTAVHGMLWARQDEHLKESLYEGHLTEVA